MRPTTESLVAQCISRRDVDGTVVGGKAAFDEGFGDLDSIRTCRHADNDALTFFLCSDDVYLESVQCMS